MTLSMTPPLLHTYYPQDQPTTDGKFMAMPSQPADQVELDPLHLPAARHLSAGGIGKPHMHGSYLFLIIAS